VIRLMYLVAVVTVCKLNG